ncbi:hypothetical protein EU805_11340 [Salipiger sp. IMCC34102]|uniref:hypothetical protein n=1 Tax=Salipiger sp. IMCC34102 TaxID=2510647 RepID=UPI00101D598F|nr:hypothetical protein [Salipiger sp. IMCC34102]RYH01786.1 hypothetical protein EU805_11340 [Salipiger sp. IMCC34102]
MNELAKAPTPSNSSRIVLNPAKSDSNSLITSLRSPEGDELNAVDALIVRRASTAINLGFVPDWTPRERADVVAEYVKALRRFPEWVVNTAFDYAARTMARRATPGELVTIATQARRPITDELDRRRRAEDDERIARQSLEAAKPSKKAAAEILERAGFTPNRFAAVGRRRMATTIEDLAADSDPARRPAHWSEGLSADDPRMVDLRRAREGNALVQTARAEREGG